MTPIQRLARLRAVVGKIAIAIVTWVVLCLPWGFEPAAMIVFGLLTAIGLPHYWRNEERAR